VLCGATTGATASRCDIKASVDWGGETSGEIDFAVAEVGGESVEKVDKNDVNDDGGDIENFENMDGDSDISSEFGEVE
jgi:hypothetical protein